ncbi:MAG: hypothetical protein ACXADA_20040 [Candidatus Hodarchaeales archaeon]
MASFPSGFARMGIISGCYGHECDFSTRDTQSTPTATNVVKLVQERSGTPS